MKGRSFAMALFPSISPHYIHFGRVQAVQARRTMKDYFVDDTQSEPMVSSAMGYIQSVLPEHLHTREDWGTAAMLLYEP
jgi:hypothetical protein